MKDIAQKLVQCDDKIRRQNLKCKRRRSLIKKGIELSKIGNMDVLMIMKDHDTGRIIQYNSGDKSRGAFVYNEAGKALKTLKAKG